MDLKELVQLSEAEAHERKFLRDLTDALSGFSKPLIAAVVGFAVGARPRQVGGRLTWVHSWAAGSRLRCW